MQSSVRALFAASYLATSATACFTYRPPATGAPVPTGSVVRATLRPEYADSLALEVGPHVAMVSGHLVADSGDVFAILGETVTRLDGADDLAGSTTVHIPRRFVRTMDVRRFAAARTALLIGGLAAVTLSVRSAAGSVSGGSGNGPSGGK